MSPSMVGNVILPNLEFKLSFNILILIFTELLILSLTPLHIQMYGKNIFLLTHKSSSIYHYIICGSSCNYKTFIKIQDFAVIYSKSDVCTSLWHENSCFKLCKPHKARSRTNERTSFTSRYFLLMKIIPTVCHVCGRNDH